MESVSNNDNQPETDVLHAGFNDRSWPIPALQIQHRHRRSDYLADHVRPADCPYAIRTPEHLDRKQRLFPRAPLFQSSAYTRVCPLPRLHHRYQKHCKKQ